MIRARIPIGTGATDATDATDSHGQPRTRAITFYEELTIDYAIRLGSYLSVEQLSRSPAAVNRAALQAFAKLVKAAGIESLLATRTRAEVAFTDFGALRSKLMHE